MESTAIADEVLIAESADVLQHTLADQDIGTHAELCIRKALDWHHENTVNSLSLKEWMTVLRVTQSQLALQVEHLEGYRYLEFEQERNKIVVYNPRTQKATALEETSIQDNFSNATKNLFPSEYKPQQKYPAVTAVTTSCGDSTLVYGEYNCPFQEKTSTGNTIWYHPKTVFRLPEPMTSSELNKWIEQDNEQSNKLQAIIKHNESTQWGAPNTAQQVN